MNRFHIYIFPIHLLAMIIMAAFPSSAAASDHGVVINEVMASNATIHAYEDGNHEDWVELYNPGDEVLLTRPDQVRVDALPPMEIPTDISYGRKPDGAEEWYFFDEPTPGEPNTTAGAEDILEPPTFSIEGGFYQEAFDLEISHDDPDVLIIYTLDGSEPCIHNLDGVSYPFKNDYPYHPDEPFGDTLALEYLSKTYEESITVADRSAEEDKLARIRVTVQPPYYIPDEPVFKGTVVRARAYKEGMLPSDIITHSYFVSPQGPDMFHLPVISISVQENYLFDYYDGIYTPGVDADQWRIDNPGATFIWPFYGNWRRRGAEWEYPAHIEIFEQPDHQRALHQDIGIRIHGGATRSYPMKSLRLYARNQYTNSHLTYDFFGDGLQGYKRLILRNSGNDFPTEIWSPGNPSRTMFRDASIQALVSHMHMDTQAYLPALVFLNGEYWGIQNIRERYDKHYLLRNYGAEEEHIDLLTGKDEVKEGDNQHYLATIQYIEDHGLQDEAHYQYIQSRIDTENFIDYQIANIYADNTDWPGNNIDFWRYRTDAYEPDAPRGKDGRWRWLLYDTDFGLGLWGGEDAYENNTLAFATATDGSGWPNPPWSTFLLRSFLENDGFRNDFINRFADLMNTAFLPERAKSVINEMKAEVAPDIEKHMARWGYPDAYDDWVSYVGVKTDFLENRPDHQRAHIKEHFGLEKLVNVSLDVSHQLEGYIRLNTIDVHRNTPGVAELPYPWTGKYFKDIPVTAEAIANPGHTFSHWEGATESEDPLITTEAEKDLTLIAHFQRMDVPVIIHYWFFDTNIPNNIPLESLDAFYTAAGVTGESRIGYTSSLEGYPFYDGHPNWRKASMERRNMPTILNYHPELNDDIPYTETSMRGIQVRQPFMDEDRENTMIFHLPSNGFKDLVFRFAARDEGAADSLIVHYRTGPEEEWSTHGLEHSSWPLGFAYQLYEISFQGITAVENNPAFQVRLRFAGDDMEADAGDRVTFNNISLEGRAAETHLITASAGPNGTMDPVGRIPVYEGDTRHFRIIPDENYRIIKAELDNYCILDSIQYNDAGEGHFTLSDITEDHYLSIAFSLDEDALSVHDDHVALYPNPATDEITITSLKKVRRVDIFHQDGRLMWSRADLDHHDLYIDTGVFRNGLYFVRLETEGGVVVKKLQVMR